MTTPLLDPEICFPRRRLWNLLGLIVAVPLAVWIIGLAVYFGWNAPQWRSVTSDEGKFRVEFPGPTEYKQETLAAAYGEATMHHLGTHRRRRSECYMVSYEMMPEVWAKSVPVTPLLQQSADALVRSTPGLQNIEIKPWEWEGFPGIEVTGTLGQRGILHCRFLFASPRLYRVYTLSTLATTLPDDFLHFHQSFQIVK
jgi:hypothetical protein